MHLLATDPVSSTSLNARLLLGFLTVAGFTVETASREPDEQTRELGTASLSGHVIDRDVKETRLIGVRVMLLREPGSTPVRQTVTEPDGSFVFPQLPAGSYSISASSKGWLTTAYGQRKPGRSGVVLVVEDGTTRKDLTITMFRGSVVAGRIRAENGQPMVGTLVEAYRMHHSPTGSAIYAVGSTNTDDRGEYRLIDLSPGEYFIRANHAVSRVITGQTFSVQPGRKTGYVPMFFPSAISPGEASTVSVGAGETRSGIDMTFSAVPLAQISGSLSGLLGPPKNISFRRLYDDGLLRSGEVIDSEVGPDGRFVLANVRPGPLTLLVRTSGDYAQDVYWALTRLVIDGDASSLAIHMRPGLRISGEVRFVSTAQPVPSVANLSFMAWPSGAGAVETGSVQTAPIEKDGSFSIAGLIPGSYFLNHQSKTQWAFASIRQGGMERVMGTLEVQSDLTDIVVTLSDRPASLSGRLLVPPGALVTDYTVVAFPADPTIRAARPRALFSANVDTAGRFTMPYILPGDYLVAVSDDIEIGAWSDPRVLEQLSAAGIAVRILAAEAKTQDISIRR